MRRPAHSLLCTSLTKDHMFRQFQRIDIHQVNKVHLAFSSSFRLQFYLFYYYQCVFSLSFYCIAIRSIYLSIYINLFTKFTLLTYIHLLHFILPPCSYPSLFVLISSTGAAWTHGHQQVEQELVCIGHRPHFLRSVRRGQVRG